MEIWKDVVGYEGIYKVSEFGDVKRVGGDKRGHIGKVIRSRKTRRGYLLVTLHHNNKREDCSVHKLVAKAFIGNIPEGKQVNHKDLNKEHNHFSNLEYLTPEENVQHAIDNGAYLDRIGTKNSQSKLTENDVLEIRRLRNEHGLELKLIAKMFKIHWHYVYELAKGRFWSHI